MSCEDKVLYVPIHTEAFKLSFQLENNRAESVDMLDGWIELAVSFCFSFWLVVLLVLVVGVPL